MILFILFSGFGLASCFIRILLCICPSQCISSDRSSTFEKELDHSTKLLQMKESDTNAKANVSMINTDSKNIKLIYIYRFLTRRLHRIQN